MKRHVRVTKGRKIARLKASADDGKRTHDLSDDLAQFYKPLKKPVTLRLDADVLPGSRKKDTATRRGSTGRCGHSLNPGNKQYPFSFRKNVKAGPRLETTTRWGIQ